MSWHHDLYTQIKQGQQVEQLYTCTALRTQSSSHSTARGEGAQPCPKVCSEHPRDRAEWKIL